MWCYIYGDRFSGGIIENFNIYIFFNSYELITGGELRNHIISQYVNLISLEWELENHISISTIFKLYNHRERLGIVFTFSLKICL